MRTVRAHGGVMTAALAVPMPRSRWTEATCRVRPRKSSGWKRDSPEATAKRAPKVPQIIRECAGRARTALVITAGFGELGPEALALHRDMGASARAAGVAGAAADDEGDVVAGADVAAAIGD